MNEGTPSITAIGSSLIRAVHTRCDPKPIFVDPWGDLLVPEEFKKSMTALAVAALGYERESTLDDWIRGNTFYAVLMTRSRYAEDALHAAISSGIKQYVLIGAGFDSYILRRTLETRDFKIFEIDHPATQALKIERLKSHEILFPETVQFLSADLAREELQAVLSRSAFAASRPAFFSWLGVSMYLTREANISALRSIAECSASGSELVFTYHDQAFFEPDTASGAGTVDEIKKFVRSAGEPFISGFDPLELPQVLSSVGLELIEDLDDAQALERFDPASINKLKAQPLVRIAHVCVL